MPATGAMVELNTGGTWSDITGRVYHRDRIRITRGRQDQATRVDPGSLSLTLNNRGGYFSPRNPLSPLYGQIGRNTPIRVSVPGPSTYLDLDGSSTRIASTPSVTALNIAGDIDLRAEVTADWRNPNLRQSVAGRWGTAGADTLWLLSIRSGAIQFNWRDVATGGWFLQAAVPPEMPARGALRATLDVDNGSGGATATVYWAPSMAGPWVQLNTFTAATTHTLPTGTVPLSVAPSSTALTPVLLPMVGRVHAVEVRSGIGGTVVANPDFTAQTAGAAGFTDGAGRVWSVAAGALSNRSIRFIGEVSSWPARWDVSGGDVYVPIQAAGIMRRLGQGASPLASTLRRRITGDVSTLAYWPMEDGQDATAAYSPLPGISPMQVAGLGFGSDDSLPGSSALPTVGSSGGSVLGAVRASATGSWCVECVYKIPTAPAGDANAQFLVFTTTAGATWRIGVGASAIHVDVTASDGTSIYTGSTLPTSFFGDWGRFYVEAQPSGSSVSFVYGWQAIGGGGFAPTGSYTGSVGAITSVRTVWPAALSGTSVGHLAVFGMYEPTAFNSADSGFATEDAGQRIVRLCGEEGIPVVAPHGLPQPAEVGPQRPDTVLDLLGEAGDADIGVLYEARDRIALAYRTRASLYNQAPVLALDYQARGEVAPPLEPTEDDTATRNDITISRPNGSSARITRDSGPLSVQAPPAGVGRYTTSEQRNVQTDAQLSGVAGWLLHLGTIDEPRYPSVTVDLAAGPWLRNAATAVDVGDLITISNPPVWLPPGDILLMCQGYTETLGAYDWSITYNCTPGSAWRVGVVGDSVLGRVSPGGCSTLATGATATATSLSVAVAAGKPLWRTTATNYPLDLRIAGEVVTLTAVSGASSPQTFTVTRGINGITKSLPAGAVIELATPSTAAL